VVFLLLIENSGDPKVNDIHLVFLCAVSHKQVLGLEISVDDPALVDLLKDAEKLVPEDCHRAQAELLKLTHISAEVFTEQVGDDQVVFPDRLAGEVVPRHMGYIVQEFENQFLGFEADRVLNTWLLNFDCNVFHGNNISSLE